MNFLRFYEICPVQRAGIQVQIAQEHRIQKVNSFNNVLLLVLFLIFVCFWFYALH